MPHITQIDMDGVSELMLAFAREFSDLGYEVVAEDIRDPASDIGSAVASPSTTADVMFIAAYLKEIAKELLEEEPSEERSEAIEIAKKTWAMFQKLVQ